MKLRLVLVLSVALMLSGCIGDLTRSDAELLLRQYVDQFLAEDWSGLAEHFALPATIRFQLTSSDPHLFATNFPERLPVPQPDCYVQHTMNAEHSLDSHDCSVLLGFDDPLAIYYFHPPGEDELSWIELYEGEVLTSSPEVIAAVLQFEHGKQWFPIVDVDFEIVDVKQSNGIAKGSLVMSTVYRLYLNGDSMVSRRSIKRISNLEVALIKVNDAWKIQRLTTIKTREIDLENDIIIF